MAAGNSSRPSMGRSPITAWREVCVSGKWWRWPCYLIPGSTARAIKQGSNRYERRVLKRRDIEERLYDEGGQ